MQYNHKIMNSNSDFLNIKLVSLHLSFSGAVVTLRKRIPSNLSSNNKTNRCLHSHYCTRGNAMNTEEIESLRKRPEPISPVRVPRNMKILLTLLLFGNNHVIIN